MRRKTMFALLAALAALAAAACALMLLFRARENARRSEVGMVWVEPISMEELPVARRTEDWFVGDWAGLVTGIGEGDRGWTDFGVAASDFLGGGICLLRVYSAASGYEADLGSTHWSITEHDMDGFSMTCTHATYWLNFLNAAYQESYSFQVGQTIRFTYSEMARSTVAGSSVPEENILVGKASAQDDNGWSHSLILSLLPPGEKRADGAGVYPCWYGGYENMQDGFHGMFCLGVRQDGWRMFGQVIDRGDGVEIAIGVFDGGEVNRTLKYAPRDMREADLAQMFAMDDADGAFFPQFFRFHAGNPGNPWKNVSAEHKLYYETVYIPQMQEEIAALPEGPQDIWTQRQILARQGFIEYAQRLVNGDFDGIRSVLTPYIPQLVQLDADYRQEVSLADIKPGDTLADAQRLYDLHELREDEQDSFGKVGLSRGGTMYYTDGAGLLLTIPPGSDGRIGCVELYGAGYDTPDGRQVGDPYRRDKLLLYAKDAILSLGSQFLRDGVDFIDVIRMNVVLDRKWDETFLDVDGDGEKERLTLSGRAIGPYLEQPPVLCDYDLNVVETLDFGTKATLRVYKGGELIAEQVLPLALYYLTPGFCDRLQTSEPGMIRVVCYTGGTGLEEPIYLVMWKNGGAKTEYVGMIDIYS